jgi:hypothetical protein
LLFLESFLPNSILYELQFFEEFYPFVLVSDLDGAALELAQYIVAVAIKNELGIDVFGALVVNDLE